MLYGVLLLLGVGFLLTALVSSDGSDTPKDPEANDQPDFEDGTLTGTDGADIQDLAGIKDLRFVDRGGGPFPDTSNITDNFFYQRSRRALVSLRPTRSPAPTRGAPARFLGATTYTLCPPQPYPNITRRQIAKGRGLSHPS